MTGTSIFNLRDRRVSSSARARSSRNSCWSTRSTGRRRDPVGPPRGDGRAAGHGRRRDPPPARALLPARDPEPDRAGRNVPAAGGAARPLLPPRRRRLSRTSRRSLSIVEGSGRPSARRPNPVVRSRPTALPAAIEEVYVDPLLRRWIVELVRATRTLEFVELGASVRGSLALERAARALALIDGRAMPSPTIRAAVRARARLHRLVLAPEYLAEEEPTAGEVRAASGKAALRSRAAAGAGSGSAPRGGTTGLTVSSRRRVFPLVPRRRFTGTPFGERRSSRRGRGSDVAGTRARTCRATRSRRSTGSPRPASRGARGDEFVVRELCRRSAAGDDRHRPAAVDGALRRRPAVALKSAAALAAAEAIARRRRARAELGHADALRGHTRFSRRAPSRHGTCSTGFGAQRCRRAGSLAPTLAHLVDRRAASCAGLLRVRSSPISGPDVPAGTLSALRSASLGRRSGCCSGSGLGAELPRHPWRADPFRVRRRLRQARAPEPVRGLVLRRENRRPPRTAIPSLPSRGFDPIVLGQRIPAAIDTAFLRWAERRRLRSPPAMRSARTCAGRRVTPGPTHFGDLVAARWQWSASSSSPSRSGNTASTYLPAVPRPGLRARGTGRLVGWRRPIRDRSARTPPRRRPAPLVPPADHVSSPPPTRPPRRPPRLLLPGRAVSPSPSVAALPSARLIPERATTHCRNGRSISCAPRSGATPTTAVGRSTSSVERSTGCPRRPHRSRPCLVAARASACPCRGLRRDVERRGRATSPARRLPPAHRARRRTDRAAPGSWCYSPFSS